MQALLCIAVTVSVQAVQCSGVWATGHHLIECAGGHEMELGHACVTHTDHACKFLWRARTILAPVACLPQRYSECDI